MHLGRPSKFSDASQDSSKTMYFCGIQPGLVLNEQISKISLWNFRSGRARSICHQFHSRLGRLKGRERYGTDEKSVNGTQRVQNSVTALPPSLSPSQRFITLPSITRIKRPRCRPVELTISLQNAGRKVFSG